MFESVTDAQTFKNEGPIRSGQKPNAAFPPTPMMLQIKFGCNRLLVEEIFVFESVNGRTYAQTHARTPVRLPFYKLTL